MSNKCHLDNYFNSSDYHHSMNKTKSNDRSELLLDQFQHRFVSATECQLPQQIQLRESNQSEEASWCKSPALPSVDELYPYSCAICWQMGLNGTDNDTAQLLYQATEIFMKNLISSMLTRKSAYKIVDESFKFNMGREATDPYITRQENRNSDHLLRSELSHEKHIQDLGRTNQENKTRKNVVINLQDFIYALRYFKRNLIKPATMYEQTVERLLHAHYHTDDDDSDSCEVEHKPQVPRKKIKSEPA